MGIPFDPREDIRPLTEFKRDSNALLKQMAKSGRPLVLTRNGKAAMVALDPVAYRQLAQAFERYETIAAVQRGLEQIKRGEYVMAEDLLAELRGKHAVPAKNLGRRGR
jgi:PHD/YefM family antitoxin component YafN of YafNO toxin-antitoxin module